MKLFAFLLLAVSCFGQTAHYRHVQQVLENDLTVTPGDVRTSSKQQICSVRTGTVRNVSAATKRQVYLEYGLSCGAKCGQLNEVDHLISLELGGSNDIKNLWPQPYKVPGARQKDVLENKLHMLVCDGALPLGEAQKEISQDWYGAYKEYVVSGADAKLGR